MSDAAIALNRFGLGARLGESPPADPRRWLAEQLRSYDPTPPQTKSLSTSAELIGMLAGAREDRRDLKAAGKEVGPNAQQAGAPRPFRDLRDEYVAGVGVRTQLALTSPTPFAERLVHFWSNHFAISVDKAAVIGFAGAFENEAIRPHVMGRFADLLGAVERHPAMLLYLDQAQSVGPDSPLGEVAGRRGKERGLNENLAREIMELHTLGVRTGYAQADVTEFARALTGWTVGGLARQPRLQGPGPRFWFAELIHQPGTRTIMGKRYGQSGEAQGQAVLDDLAAHPATAHHLATKLARHFCADDPPASLVTRLEQAYLASRGDLPTLYRVLIEAPECWVAPAPKFRTPWDWTLAALRASGVSSLPGTTAAAAFQQLGQSVWKPGSPAGYDDLAASWIGPDALYRRVEVAERIASRAGEIDARALAEKLFPGALSDATRQAVARAESGSQALALLLASPEMMRR